MTQNRSASSENTRAGQGKVILGMTMSLDGFINDRNGSVARLYPDLGELRQTELMRDYVKDTGAVVMGWNAYRMAEGPDLYADAYEFQVPIFVITRELPRKWPKENEHLTFTFVTAGIESAIIQAQRAAGGKHVQVIGGASTAQRCLRAGLIDEIHIYIMPVLLCGGLRLFEHLGDEPIELEKVKVIDDPVRTHLRYRLAR